MLKEKVQFLWESCSHLSMLWPVNQERCFWQLFELKYTDFPWFRCCHLTSEELLIARGWRLGSKEKQCSCLTAYDSWNQIFLVRPSESEGLRCCPSWSLFHVHAYIPTYMHAYIPTCACLRQWRAPGTCTHARKNTEWLEILHLPETLVPLLNCVLACKNACSVSQLSIFLMAKSTALSLSIVFEDSYMKR